jgi:hypothetical protein
MNYIKEKGNKVPRMNPYSRGSTETESKTESKVRGISTYMTDRKFH